MSEEIHFLEDGYYVDKLEKEIQQLKEELKYTVPIVEHNKIISEKNKENQQLKDNWNKLKEWTKKAVDKYYDCDLRVEMIYKNVLNKMQELENGDSDE